MRTTRFALSALSVAMFGGVFSSSALAEQGEATAQSQPETIAVTGSRIKHRGDTPSPIQALDAEALSQTGSISLGEVLQELPSVGASLNGNGSAGSSHGSSSLNLRNLGENRSLILVNGHRWVNGAGTRGFRDFVDMNTIPQAIVKRVEVLQDGATAIYGADAIAGVVNIYTHDEYQGTQVKAYYGQSGEGDKESANIDVLWGKDIDDTNVMLAFSHSDSKPIYTQDRQLTSVPLNGLTSATPQGLFREDSLIGLVGFDVPSGGITRDENTDGSDIDSWRAVTGDDKYNRYYNNYVVGPSERTSVYLQTVSSFDTTTLKTEVLFNQRKSDQQFSPALSAVRGSRGFIISDDAAVNPFGIEFSGNDFRHSAFLMENGYRINAQNVKTLRVGLGLDGEFSGDWVWDSFLSWAKNKGEFTSNNQMHLDKLALGLRACDTTGISADVSDLEKDCVAVNLFEPLTSAMVDYINFTGHDNNEASQLDFTFNATGSLLELPAGELAVAAGIEYRKEKGIDTPDNIIASEPRLNSYRTTTSSPRLGTIGEYDLKEAYVELNLPVFDGEAWAETLELSLATRFSDYSTFGSTVNSKAGIFYRPNSELAMRATWAEGFRAPSILELFEGQRVTLSAVTDPCVGNAALIGCQGVPADYVQADSNVQVTTGGNVLLQPETSKNLAFGVVYAPEYIDDFSVSLDFYDISIDNTVSEFGAQNILDLCANKGKNCDVISRDSRGEIINIIDGPVNLNSTNVAGMDVVFNYGVEAASGQWDFSLNLSKLNKLVEESTLSDGSIEIEDKVGRAASRESFPKWRGMLSTRWNNDAWSANYNARYIGHTTETFSGEELAINSMVYHNLSASYDFSDSMQVKAGINNLLDKQPPVSRTNKNINFDQNTYNAVGRFMYIQISYTL